MTAVGFSKESLARNPDPSSWVSFERAGRAVVSSGKVEFGQGINTALVQIAADALGLAAEQIELAPVRTDRSPHEGVTSGSLSIQHSGRAIQLVCSQLRIRAEDFAREKFGPVKSFRNGEFSCDRGAASYWSIPAEHLFAFDASALEGEASSPPAQQALLRRDIPAKIFGRAAYIHDLRFDGLLHGRVVRPQGTVADIGTAEIRLPKSSPGIRLIRNRSFLGVLAETEWEAVRTAERLVSTVEWDIADREPVSHAILPDWLESGEYESTSIAETSAESPVEPHKTFSGTYFRPFIAHASIAPSCAIAWWRDGRIDVWSHTQGIFNLRDDILIWLARDHPEICPDDVVVHHAEGAGCYGHNPADDVAFDAVLMAEHAGGRPVRVVNSRADELGQGPFGPCHLVKLSVATDATGRICRWDHRHFANGYTMRPGRSGTGNPSFLAATQIDPPFEHLVSLDPPAWIGGGSDRNSNPIYDFPSRSIVSNRLLKMPIRTSALRSLGGFANVFAIESMMTEIASAYGCDPIAFRLAHLDDPRAHDVIKAAIAGADWWNDEHGDGIGHGFGFARYKSTGAWCAIAARIEADEQIRLTDLSIGVDVGLVVNRDGVANQIEGGAIQGASWTLKEEVRIHAGRVESASWDTYPILGFDEAPRIRLTIIDQPDQPSLGAGEAAQGPVAAAIGNAVHDALGARIRHLPISYERLLSALSLPD